MWVKLISTRALTSQNKSREYLRLKDYLIGRISIFNSQSSMRNTDTSLTPETDALM